ncbi:MAG: rhodanese-like domain-containing protein [Bacteroidia bacterium]|nr:rhodanese-like domain-containing protein [Bacteroidia bacterium]NNJ56403.1 rhodanese-like domain-containing protein [Bacteroidia bacterium]
MTIQDLLDQGGTIVDVRTPGEFMGGNVVGSINIPLSEVAQRVEEFKNLNAPVLLCCMSGARSGQATGFLQAQGVECYNAGGWMELNYAVSQLS